MKNIKEILTVSKIIVVICLIFGILYMVDEEWYYTHDITIINMVLGVVLGVLLYSSIKDFIIKKD